MEIETVRDFFMWCTIINVALFALSFLLCAGLGNWIYRIHTKWFPMPRATFSVVLYSFLGMYKIMLIMFNIVPYVAFLIIMG